MENFKNLLNMGRKRIFKVNESYFEKIDSEEKAYFLGFLYADGYNNNKKGRVVLALKSDDVEILEAFRKSLDSNIPIHIRSYKRNDGYKEIKTSCYFELNSRKISNDLVKLGCVQNKTNKIRVPEFLEKHLIRHFIRGYFDGDGCIYLHKFALKNGNTSDYYSTTIMGNYEFIYNLRDVIESEICKKYFISKRSGKNKKAVTLRISGNTASKFFLNYLYKDSTIFLKRKNDLYRSLLKIVNKTYTKVFVYDKENMELLYEFDKKVDACKVLNIGWQSIYNYLDGVHKHKKYTFSESKL